MLANFFCRGIGNAAILLTFCITAFAADFLPGPNQTIVCFGDSITVGNTYGHMMQDLISQRFAERRIRVLGHGMSGDTAGGAMKRIKGDVIDVKPDWVLLNFGMNDQGGTSVDDFIANNEALIKQIEAETKARVVLVSPICNDRDRSGKVVRLHEYATALRSLAERRNLIYVPLNEESNRIKQALPEGVPLSPDGVHPNRIGYWVYTQTILEALGFPMPSEPITENIPVNVLSGEKSLLKPGSSVRLNLPTPVTINLVPTASFHANAGRAAKPVLIDGSFEEWDRSFPTSLSDGKTLIGQRSLWGGDPALWPACWVSWDDAGLNLAFRVSDDFVTNSDQVDSVVNRDCIEVCLDLRPAAERERDGAISFGGHTPHTGQYIISPKVGAMAKARCDIGNGPVGMLQGVEVASQQVSGGYQVEFRIPKAQLPDGGPTAGQSLYFDWAVIDVPASGQFSHARISRWTNSPDGWRYSRDFGKLTLIP